jgi:hypothetical protein
MRKKVRKRPVGYAVGYGRPPISSQFQPGQSGNPQGRAQGFIDGARCPRAHINVFTRPRMAGPDREGPIYESVAVNPGNARQHFNARQQAPARSN